MITICTYSRNSDEAKYATNKVYELVVKYVDRVYQSLHKTKCVSHLFNVVHEKISQVFAVI